jgi:hypothetical protein
LVKLRPCLIDHQSHALQPATTKTEAEGKADQVKGKVKNTIGGAKDATKE